MSFYRDKGIATRRVLSFTTSWTFCKIYFFGPCRFSVKLGIQQGRFYLQRIRVRVHVQFLHVHVSV